MATSSRKDDIRSANYASILLSASMTAVTHPVQMTKVMIQVFAFVISSFPVQDTSLLVLYNMHFHY